MKTNLLCPLAAVMLCVAGPAFAQDAPKWKPGIEAVVVKAGKLKNWYGALTASHLGKAFMVSASLPVPYSDLNLAREQDATEFGRRIEVASQLVCAELDAKYPPTQYPLLEGHTGMECVRDAARDGMEQVNAIIANVKR